MSTRDEILRLIGEKPKHFSAIIQRNTEMAEWVVTHSLIQDVEFKQLLYSAMNGVTNICEFGTTMHMKYYYNGFICDEDCKCVKQRIADGVSRTKQNYTAERNDEINKKREATMLAKYGCTHNLLRTEVIDKLKRPKINKVNYKLLTDRGWLYEEYVNKNRSVANIADELKVDRSTVIHYCNKENINIRKYHHVIAHNIQNILEDRGWLYEEYVNKSRSIVDIADELKVDDTTVNSYLRKQHIDIINNIGTSQCEIYLQKYIKQKYNAFVITNTRKLIKPKEIDIYLPKYKLAIEYNGIYWHRPDIHNGFEGWLEYHDDKIIGCKEKGIELLHLWEGYGEHKELIQQAINGNINNDLEQVYEDIYGDNCKMKKI